MSTASSILLPGNFCLPEVVPDYAFPGRPHMQTLVAWLDGLCSESLAQASPSLLKDPQDLTLRGIESEWEMSKQSELVCNKVVIGWLLHRVTTDTGNVPPLLVTLDKILADRLGCGVGGCSNLSFYYNWQHPDFKPGEPYDARALLPKFRDSDTPVRCRFVPVGGCEAMSMESFILGHVEMEAHACLTFDHAVKALEQIASAPEKNVNVAGILGTAAKYSEDMTRAFQRWFQDGRIKHAHWHSIQKTLKLPAELNATGMGGAQNTSIYLLGQILGVCSPEHQGNIQLESNAIHMHFVRHQRAVVDYFVQRRDVLKNYMASDRSSAEERNAYNDLARVAVKWRGAHRSRVLKYVSSVEGSDTNYVTSTGGEKNLDALKEQFDSRMHEYSELILRSRI